LDNVLYYIGVVNLLFPPSFEKHAIVLSYVFVPPPPYNLSCDFTFKILYSFISNYVIDGFNFSLGAMFAPSVQGMGACLARSFVTCGQGWTPLGTDDITFSYLRAVTHSSR
jgi:hypothetical protein